MQSKYDIFLVYWMSFHLQRKYVNIYISRLLDEIPDSVFASPR